MMRRLVEISAVLPLIVLAGCGWERKAIFKNSAGNASVEIHQTLPVNGWGIRVVLRRNDSTKILYERGEDTFLTFTDVSWSADNKYFGVLICGNPPLRMGYSLTAERLIPFSEVRSDLAAHIRTEYHLDPNKMSDEDTLLWACIDGQDAFSRHHPEAAAR
jgi:hypothetical protein